MYSSALNPNNVPAGNAAYMKQWIQSYVNIETVRKCFRCGQAIFAGTAVYMATDGKIYTYQSSEDDTYVGIAENNAKANEFVDVVVQGYLRVPGAPWTAGVLYYTNAVGILTPTPVTRRVAVGIGDSELIVYTQVDPGISALIAQNGLNSPATGVVELGGTLLQNTDINLGTYTFTLNNTFGANGTTGKLTFNRYGVGTFVDTPTYYLGTKADGSVVEILAANTVTADNGLTENTPNNVQLGGTLLKNTSISCSTFYTSFTSGSTANGNPLRAAATGTNGKALVLTANLSSGSGAYSVGYKGFESYLSTYGFYAGGGSTGFYSTGTIVGADLSGGNAGIRARTSNINSDNNGAGVFIVDNNTFADISSNLVLRRNYDAFPQTIVVGTGTGTYHWMVDTANANKLCAVTGVRYTDVTLGSEETSYEFILYRGGSPVFRVPFMMYSSGALKAPEYGANTFTGTPTSILASDVDGNIIETGNGSAMPLAWYGSFYDTVTQPTLVINTAYPMILRSTDISSGVSVVSDGTNLTRITAANAGVYNIQFSAQLRKTLGGSTEEVYIWLSKMGTAVPDSNTRITLANNGHYLVAAWNWMVSLTAGQYVQIMWYSSDIHIELTAVPAAGALPGIPSVLCTVSRVS